MKRITLTLLVSIAACGGKTLSLPPSSDSVEAGAAVYPYAAECAGSTVPPSTLKCTGLYSDFANKVVAPGIRAYAPAVPLWADYDTKLRWIMLPPGTKIDATDPNEWTFPAGTKVWKEFSRDGKRVETRLFQKVQTGFWARTTYAWNADDTDATVSGGGDIPWGTDGGIYHIPTPDECDQCHRGRSDRILGFEQVDLGLSGATGLTLPELVAEQLISPVPALTNLTVGDDGTGAAAAPLAWLHINCGTTCHNDNPNSTAYGSSMRLRLDPTQLDGRSSAGFESLTTTVGVLASTPSWLGLTRIEPHNPSHSLLVELITNRGTDNPVGNQMPPIASLLVDPTDTQSVIAWIGKMPEPPSDAGSENVDATVSDAGRDAAPADASADATPGREASVEAGADANADASADATVEDAAVDAAVEAAAIDAAAGASDDASDDAADGAADDQEEVDTDGGSDAGSSTPAMED